jgi:hypothetical protein
MAMKWCVEGTRSTRMCLNATFSWAKWMSLNVFHLTMMNRIGRLHWCCHNRQSLRRNRDVKLLMQLSQPAALGNCICRSLILGLYTRMGHCILPLWRLGEQVIAVEDAKARSRTSSPSNLPSRRWSWWMTHHQWLGGHRRRGCPSRSIECACQGKMWL